MKILALAKLENVTGNLSKETGNFCINWQLRVYFGPCHESCKAGLISGCAE